MISNPALLKITPVSPPTVNKKIKPNANKRGGRISNLPPHNVASHEKTFTPVGTAITIVAAVK
jgi:hypothetical protein